MTNKPHKGIDGGPDHPLAWYGELEKAVVRASVRHIRDHSKLTELEALALAGREASAVRHVERKPVDLEKQQALVRVMPKQPEGAGRALRRLRKQSRY